MMAVFTLGADEIRVRQMENIAEAWGFAGKYSSIERLMDDARKKRFDSVLVVDREALEDDAKIELNSLDVEIIDLKNKKVLEKKIF
ncbi:MAG: hypothetical protein GTN36_03615 [Candidatus Aenigmarchaeota archaeon]|nr:hypothetical protein [Candidatus Aenigmarchaeota archaeon]